MSKFKLDEHKMHYHIDRVAEWQYGDAMSVYPIYVEISPVGYCNHRCTFCALDFLGYKPVQLDTDYLKMNILSMALHGVRSIMFAGEGEPLLHPDITDIVRWTQRNDIDVAVTTNGIPLIPHKTEQILKHCTWIKFSVNAGDAETYGKVHGCAYDHWDKLWSNIEYAVWARNEWGWKTAIGVQAVLLPENASSLHNLAKKCRNIGVDYLVIKPYSHHAESINKQYERMMYQESYDKYLDVLSMYASSNFELITRRDSMNSWDRQERVYNTCHSVPYFWAYIMSTGDVYGCSAFLGDARFNYGNINEQTFHEIWQGAGRRKAIELMRTFDTETCRKNCRMHKINNFLHEIKNPGEHRNFI